MTTLCKRLLIALIGRKVHRNWCLVTQQDFGVTSPKGFSRVLKSLFRYSDSPCSVWRRSSNSGKKVQKRRDVGWEFGTVGVRMYLSVPNLFPSLSFHLAPSLLDQRVVGAASCEEESLHPLPLWGAAEGWSWLPPKCSGCTPSCFQQAGQDLPLSCFFKGANCRLWVMLQLCILWFRED